MSYDDMEIERLKASIRDRIPNPMHPEVQTLTELYIINRGGDIAKYYELGIGPGTAGAMFIRGLSRMDQFRIRWDGPADLAKEEYPDSAKILFAIDFLLDTEHNYPANHPLRHSFSTSKES